MMKLLIAGALAMIGSTIQLKHDWNEDCPGHKGSREGC